LADYQQEVFADGMQIMQTKATISQFDWSFTEKDLTAIEWQQKVVELIKVFNLANRCIRGRVKTSSQEIYCA
jgi:hypothetical protein